MEMYMKGYKNSVHSHDIVHQCLCQYVKILHLGSRKHLLSETKNNNSCLVFQCLKLEQADYFYVPLRLNPNVGVLPNQFSNSLYVGQ